MSIKNYIKNTKYVFFTFPRIATFLNKENIEKKKPIGLPNWKTINIKNYREFHDNGHTGFAIITGKMSGITVFDFDQIAEYEKLATKYPELKKYKTIKTKKGFHIYFNYNDVCNTGTDTLINYSGVDIRNNEAVIFAPPTKYKLLSGKPVDGPARWKFTMISGNYK